MRNIIANAISINMIAGQIPMADNYGYAGFGLSVKEVRPEDIPKDCVSVIGHADTAKVVSTMLGFDIPANRVSYTVEDGDVLFVAQYSGPRLPEGATSLPEGGTIRFFRVMEIDPVADTYGCVGERRFGVGK